MKLTITQKKSINKHVTKKLSKYNIDGNKIKWVTKTDYMGKAHDIGLYNVDIRNMGVFGASLKTAQLEIVVHDIMNSQSKAVSIHLRYHHISGGSNGVKIGHSFKVDKDGSIDEMDW